MNPPDSELSTPDTTTMLVAAAIAGGMISTFTQMSPDDAIKIYTDVLAALQRAEKRTAQ
jgi:hypothetical protein